MKVGDYVRTDDGFISKYIGKNKNKWCMSGHLSFESTIRDIRFEDTDEDNIIWESEIEQGLVKIKSSPNIIDLIEVGDVLTLKEDEDVYRVIAIPDEEIGLDDIFYFAKRYDGETEDIMIYKNTLEEELLSIVTHEQFKSMEYKVKE